MTARAEPLDQEGDRGEAAETRGEGAAIPPVPAPAQPQDARPVETQHFVASNASLTVALPPARPVERLTSSRSTITVELPPIRPVELAVSQPPQTIRPAPLQPQFEPSGEVHRIVASNASVTVTLPPARPLDRLAGSRSTITVDLPPIRPAEVAVSQAPQTIRPAQPTSRGPYLERLSLG